MAGIAYITAISALSVGGAATVAMWIQQVFGKRQPYVQAGIAAVGVIVFFVAASIYESSI